MEYKMKMEVGYFCMAHIKQWATKQKPELIILTFQVALGVDFPPMHTSIGAANITPLNIIFDSGISLHNHVATVVLCSSLNLKLAMIQTDLKKEEAHILMLAYNYVLWCAVMACFEWIPYIKISHEY